MSSVIQKGFALKLAATDSVGDRGTFSGTALVYNEVDSVGDRIREGCFRKSISDAQGRFPCLWTHNPTEVLGSVSVEADGRTLAVRGSLLTDAIPKAREIHALLVAKALKGLSVGFAPIRATPIEGGGTEFIEGRLLEVSLCAVPAYASARVDEVRSLSELVKSLDRNHDREHLLALRDSIDEILGGTGPPDPAPELLAALTRFDAAKWKQR